jgi:hypothetical protein
MLEAKVIPAPSFVKPKVPDEGGTWSLCRPCVHHLVWTPLMQNRGYRRWLQSLLIRLVPVACCELCVPHRLDVTFELGAYARGLE